MAAPAEIMARAAIRTIRKTMLIKILPLLAGDGVILKAPLAYYHSLRRGCTGDAITRWWLSPLRRNDYVAIRAVGHTEPEVKLLNRTDRPTPMPGEADVKYLDGDFRVVRPGSFVRCAVTGVPIPLEELRYWNVDLQEAYVTPDVVLQRQGNGYPGKK
jgi:hypothetical protein